MPLIKQVIANPKALKKSKPGHITQEEIDAGIAEYKARGGVITELPEEGSMVSDRLVFRDGGRKFERMTMGESLSNHRNYFG